RPSPRTTPWHRKCSGIGMEPIMTRRPRMQAVMPTRMSILTATRMSTPMCIPTPAAMVQQAIPDRMGTTMPADTIMHTSITGLELAGLLQLASPALPIGAFSYSPGLEAAIDAGLVQDAASAQDWIEQGLEIVS